LKNSGAYGINAAQEEGILKRLVIGFCCFGSATSLREPKEMVGHALYLNSIAALILASADMEPQREIVVRAYGGQVGRDHKTEAQSCVDHLMRLGNRVVGDIEFVTLETRAEANSLVTICRQFVEGIRDAPDDDHLLIVDQAREEISKELVRQWSKLYEIRLDPHLVVCALPREDIHSHSNPDYLASELAMLRQLGVQDYESYMGNQVSTT
jgi:hypothetical protein